MEVAHVEEVEDLRDHEHVDDHRARRLEIAALTQRVEDTQREDSQKDRHQQPATA
jgi:hypothetical protein